MKQKQPKMDYAQKTVYNILTVMEVANKNEYNQLIDNIKILLSDTRYNEIDKGSRIMEQLYENNLFYNITLSIMADALIDLPQFKTTT